MSSSGLTDNLFSAFLDWLYQSGEIKVPSDFHSRCDFISKLIDNDSSCLINTILGYAINNASETEYKVESGSKTLEKLLTVWLNQININIDGIPKGLQQLSKEYFRERWQGASLCLMRVSNWQEITVDKTTIVVPTVLWFVNGMSIYIKRPNEKNYTLGTDQYFLDATLKTELKNTTKEQVIIQKPFDRWYVKYPTPYLIRNGVLKNYLTLRSLQDKVDEIISKVLPYLFVITKGNKEEFEKGVTFTDPELNAALEQFRELIEKYKIEKARTPANMIPYDQKYDHLIPDLLPVLKEDLYNELNRRILTGLGFVDVIQGISSTRKESIINPKPFITELNTGVEGFKDMLMECIDMIIDKNKDSHRKLFTDSQYLKIVNTPLKINIEAILDLIRSGYDRGTISIQTYAESLGMDFETELQRRKDELKDGTEDIMYPHIITNQEKDFGPGEERRESVAPAKSRNSETIDKEKQGKKPGTPEANNYNQASEELTKSTTRIICKNCKHEFEPQETEMKVGQVRCPSCMTELTDLENYVVPATEITAKVEYIRVRLENPDNFEQDSFRTIWLSDKRGIKGIIGRPKGKTTTRLQAVLFDKDKWTEDEAKKWAKDRQDTMKGYLQFLELEEANIVGEPIDTTLAVCQELELEMAPYQSNSDLPANVRKYPEGAQTAFRKAFNNAFPKGDAYAFPVAYSVMNRWLKKHKSQASEEIKNES